MSGLGDEPLAKRTRSNKGSPVPEISNNQLTKDASTTGTGKLSPANQVGPYLLGQRLLCSCPIKSIAHYVARNPLESNDKYYTLKVLNLSSEQVEDFVTHMQARGLIYTEYSLLSLLKGDPGVIQCHGLIKDQIMVKASPGQERVITRVSLVLDCLLPHDFSTDSREYINLQKLVTETRKLPEPESIRILLQVARTVKKFHAQNIIHRDLKLSNLVLHRRSHMVIVTNFCLGKHLSSPNELLTDQRGAPAYTSPDILSGKPYAGKPSDIWSLGVILYTLVYGSFPYLDGDLKVLHRKIKNCEFSFPSTINVCPATQYLIKNMMHEDPISRFTASDVVEFIHTVVFTMSLVRPLDKSHLVPDFSSAQHSNQQKELRKMSDRPRRTYVFHVPVVPDTEPSKHSDRNCVKIREMKVPKSSLSSLTELLQQQDTLPSVPTREPESNRRAVYGRFFHRLPVDLNLSSSFGRMDSAGRLVINRMNSDARTLNSEETARLQERLIARRVGQTRFQR